MGFLDHCGTLPPEDLSNALNGFGFSTILSQFQHCIGAERYWTGVLKGHLLVDEREEDGASIDALRAFRKRVARATVQYLRSVTTEQLNAPCKVTVWGGQVVDRVPALIILRPQFHSFHHLGQVAAMVRLLGHQMESGLDFSVL